MGSQYRSMSFVFDPHQSTSLTVTWRPLDARTTTVLPRQWGPIADRSLEQAAATMDPGGYR